MKCLFEMMLYKDICFERQFTQFFKMRIADILAIVSLSALLLVGSTPVWVTNVNQYQKAILYPVDELFHFIISVAGKAHTIGYPE